MNASTACPGQAQLKRLLFGTLSDADQAELTRHLDGCPGCQQTLEHLAVGSAAWCEAAKACGERAAAPESAYWPALKSLEKQISPLTETRPAADTPAGPSGDLRLDFLGPSQDPGHLGRLDHFEILEIIGRGGMGVVLKGFDACL
jgi:hypothetical protein